MLDTGKVMMFTGTGLQAPLGFKTKTKVTLYNIFYSVNNISWSPVLNDAGTDVKVRVLGTCRVYVFLEASLMTVFYYLIV